MLQMPDTIRQVEIGTLCKQQMCKRKSCDTVRLAESLHQMVLQELVDDLDVSMIQKGTVYELSSLVKSPRTSRGKDSLHKLV